MEKQSEIIHSMLFSEFNNKLHVCYIYNDDEERARTMSNFFALGLASKNNILCIVDKIEPLDIKAELIKLGVEEELLNTNFALAENESTYCPGGKIEPDSLLANFKYILESSKEAGFTGTRISGDMAFVPRRQIENDNLMAYETGVNRFLANNEVAVTAICEYDARKFDGSTIMDVLSVHPVMIIQGQLVKNPYYNSSENYS